MSLRIKNEEFKEKSSKTAANDYKEQAQRMKALQDEQKKVVEKMKKIPYKIAILSSKGGVGKSFVTSNLAIALSSIGKNVAVLDADFHGPSIPKMLGINLSKGLLARDDGSIIPAVSKHGVKVVSVGLMLPQEDTPVIWRGSIKTTAIRQLLAFTDWEGIEYLFIDLPPGTGDEQLTIAQIIPHLTGFLLVTIPSEVSKYVVKKAANFAQKLNVPILGIVENMSYFKCDDGKTYYIFGKGAAEEISKEYNIPFLGKIPIDPKIRESNDNGIAFFIDYPELEASKMFMEITKNFLKILESKQTA